MKPKMTLQLDDRRLTMLHSAGMAGLAMTLNRLDELYPQPHQRPAELSWLLDEVKIELFWTGDDAIALAWLLSESFKIDGDGLISLTGLVSMDTDISVRVAIHQGITKSFLQHGLSRKSAGNAAATILIEGKDVEIGYKKLASYSHQNFTKDLCDRKGRLKTESIGIKSWLYPGATVRHNIDEKATIFREPPELALALLFAPLACQLFFLPNKGFFSDPRIVVVIPAITNLIESTKSLSSMVSVNYQARCILHPKEAGWRFFERDRQINKIDSHRITSCQIVTFQSEVWAKQQRLRSRVDVMEVRDNILDRYHKLTSKLSTNRVVTGKKDKHFGSPAYMVIIIAYLNNWSVRVACRRHNRNYLNKQANSFSFIRSKFLNP